MNKIIEMLPKYNVRFFFLKDVFKTSHQDSLKAIMQQTHVQVCKTSPLGRK